MNWLAPSEAFRDRLASASKAETPHARLEQLAAIANSRLSFIETIQLDTQIRKTADAPDARFENVRVAILTATTADHLLPPTRVAGLRRGLRIETYVTAYGQHRQELLDPASPLHAYKPNAVVFNLAAQEFVGTVPVNASRAEADQAIVSAVEDICTLWRHARERFRGIVIQQSFINVEPALFGGLDAMVAGAPARLIAQLNARLAEAAQANGVLWLDIAAAVARDGLDSWFDVARWLQAKMEIAPQAAGAYGEMLSRLIGAARGRSRKCLVLDLDNTLWGGVVGDDGLDGIILGQGTAAGEAHLALQRYARQLKDRGIILAVCSKNEAATAEAVFREHPEMLLKRSDIACFIANWTDKATNLKSIAQQLNIGLDSLVFVDDNPVERSYVRAELPMVAVPELPADPAGYVRTLSDAGYFEAIAFTRDDAERAEQYAANVERESLRNSTGGIDAYLQQLEMTMEYGGVTSANLARVTQLLNKTNQFNNTTIRRSESEIEAIGQDPSSLLLQFRLLDKFGDNGIVSAVVARPVGDDLDISSWVMSCRVFGRQLEHEIMNVLVETVRARNVATLTAVYAPTAKNGVMRDLFPQLGFEKIEDAGEGRSLWRLDVARYEPRATWIIRRKTPDV